MNKRGLGLIFSLTVLFILVLLPVVSAVNRDVIAFVKKSGTSSPISEAKVDFIKVSDGSVVANDKLTNSEGKTSAVSLVVGESYKLKVTKNEDEFTGSTFTVTQSSVSLTRLVEVSRNFGETSNADSSDDDSSSDSSEDSETTREIKLRVKDSSSGIFISEATVEIIKQTNGEVIRTLTTSSDGYTTPVSLQTNQNYFFRVSKSCYGTKMFDGGYAQGYSVSQGQGVFNFGVFEIVRSTSRECNPTTTPASSTTLPTTTTQPATGDGYYLDIVVRDKNGNPVKDANVIYFENGARTGSIKTNSQGSTYTSRAKRWLLYGNSYTFKVEKPTTAENDADTTEETSDSEDGDDSSEFVRITGDGFSEGIGKGEECSQDKFVIGYHKRKTVTCAEFRSTDGALLKWGTGETRIPSGFGSTSCNSDEGTVGITNDGRVMCRKMIADARKVIWDVEVSTKATTTSNCKEDSILTRARIFSNDCSKLSFA